MSQYTSAKLPDFRNLGVILRCILLVEGGGYLVSFANEAGLVAAFQSFMAAGVLREFVLLVVLSLLAAVAPLLTRQPYRVGVALVLAVAALCGWGAHMVYTDFLYLSLAGNSVHSGLVSMLAGACVLGYFHMRQWALTPTLTEARLIALQARIRPHFLFNSLNTVLGLMRTEQKTAERILENLADLYRAFLAEAGRLVPLSRELELARAYSEIETMRLGDRLRVNWQCQEVAMSALVPPLILQPLLENAVYHGVEPSESGGEVGVSIYIESGQLNLVMRNPCTSPSHRQGGNRMALDNIRERLALHFDAEAELSLYKAGKEFVVHIRMPYKHG